MVIVLFDRTLPGRLDDSKILKNLHRFNDDEYATKYLVQCFNPEFRIIMVMEKDFPDFNLHGCMIEPRYRVGKTIEEVF